MEPDYIVIYDPDTPELHGKWYDRNQLHSHDVSWADVMGGDVISYVPSSEFRLRSDGAVAQVWIRESLDFSQ